LSIIGCNRLEIDCPTKNQILSLTIKLQKFLLKLILKETKVPIIVLHGNQDKAVYYGSSLKLMIISKKDDKMINIEGYNNFSKNPQ